MTRTKPNRTLYVAALPHKAGADAVEALFKGEPGFVAVRMVRRMCFVDFETDRFATAAMRKHQGHKFEKDEAGVVIDYDKDVPGKRDAHAERQRRQQAIQEQMQATDAYGCSLCGALAVNVQPGFSLETCPVRDADKSLVVDEAASLRRLRVSRCPRRLFKHPDASVEWQYPVACPGCSAMLGYRSNELGSLSAALFLHPGSISLVRSATVATSTHTVASSDTDTARPVIDHGEELAGEAVALGELAASKRTKPSSPESAAAFSAAE